MSISEFYVSGGTPFMHPILLALLVNLGLIIYVAYFNVKKKAIHEKWLTVIKHIGGFALAWGAFGTLVGLFSAFDAIEAMGGGISMQMLAGGLKVALITTLFGFLVFNFTILAVIILKLTGKDA